MIYKVFKKLEKRAMVKNTANHNQHPPPGSKKAPNARTWSWAFIFGLAFLFAIIPSIQSIEAQTGAPYPPNRHVR
jgi:hypothetical protein